MEQPVDTDAVIPAAVNRTLDGLGATHVRTLTVGCLHSSRGSKPAVPFIRLAGKWLEQAGFSKGDALAVTVSQGELRLTRCPKLEPTAASSPLDGFDE